MPYYLFIILFIFDLCAVHDDSYFKISTWELSEKELKELSLYGADKRTWNDLDEEHKLACCIIWQLKSLIESEFYTKRDIFPDYTDFKKNYKSSSVVGALYKLFYNFCMHCIKKNSADIPFALPDAYYSDYDIKDDTLKIKVDGTKAAHLLYSPDYTYDDRKSSFIPDPGYSRNDIFSVMKECQDYFPFLKIQCIGTFMKEIVQDILKDVPSSTCLEMAVTVNRQLKNTEKKQENIFKIDEKEMMDALNESFIKNISSFYPAVENKSWEQLLGEEKFFCSLFFTLYRLLEKDISLELIFHRFKTSIDASTVYPSVQFWYLFLRGLCLNIISNNIFLLSYNYSEPYYKLNLYGTKCVDRDKLIFFVCNPKNNLWDNCWADKNMQQTKEQIFQICQERFLFLGHNFFKKLLDAFASKLISSKGAQNKTLEAYVNQDRAKLTETISTLKSEINDQISVIEGLTTEIKKSKEEAAIMNEKYESLRQLSVKAEEGKKQLKKKNDQLTAQNRSLTEIKKNIEDNFERFRNQHQDEMANMQKKITITNNEKNRNMIDQNQYLQNQVDEKDAKIVELNNATKMHDILRQNFELQVNKLNEQLENDKKKYNELTHELQKTEEELKSMTERCELFRQEIGAQTEKITSLEQLIKNVGQHTQSQQSNDNKLINQLRADLNTKNSDHEQLIILLKQEKTGAKHREDYLQNKNMNYKKIVMSMILVQVVIMIYHLALYCKRTDRQMMWYKV